MPHLHAPEALGMVGDLKDRQGRADGAAARQSCTAGRMRRGAVGSGQEGRQGEETIRVLPPVISPEASLPLLSRPSHFSRKKPSRELLPQTT